MTGGLKVLALCTYPREAAATRYRLYQYVEPLRTADITLDVRPFLTADQFSILYDRKRWLTTLRHLVQATARRLLDVIDARRYDVILVQREAMLFGPPIIEWMCRHLWHKPLVLDLDDATWVPYVSPTYGRLVNLIKCFGKTRDLLRWADLVTCGSPFIERYVQARGKSTLLLPTTVSHDLFHPGQGRDSEPPMLGWIGTPATFPFVEEILPALEELARRHAFKLLIVGSGRSDLSLRGVDVELREWSLAREVDDFRTLTIGLYPLGNTEYAAGKSGFKAIQYMMVAKPFVASPVGVCAEMGVPGRTHLLASAHCEWVSALSALLEDRSQARAMGEAGRHYAVEHYALGQQAQTLARHLHALARAPSPFPGLAVGHHQRHKEQQDAEH